MGDDRTATEQGPDRRRVTVAEASEILGITAEAVRTRIKRGKLDSVKEPPDRTGTVYVLLEADQIRPNIDPTPQGQDQTFDQTRPDEGLVEVLREQVAYLQGVIATRDRELEQRAEEIRRRDAALEREQQLAAIFAERLRELEAPAPSGLRESSQLTKKEPERAEPRHATGEAQEDPQPQQAQRPTEGVEHDASTLREWTGDVEARRSDAREAQEGVQSPWWRRWFSG